jgi:hypothetical protein
MSALTDLRYLLDTSKITFSAFALILPPDPKNWTMMQKCGKKRLTAVQMVIYFRANFDVVIYLDF